MPKLTPTPYQVKTLEEFKRMNNRLLCGHEPGVGKTLAECLIAALFPTSAVLIVPSNKTDDFKKELQNGTDLVGVICKNSKHDVSKVEILIISYELASTNRTFQTRKWDCMVVDEAHMLKTENAKRTLVILPMLIACKNVALFTGTPQINRPSELFNLLQAVQPEKFKSRLEFTTRYCDGKLNELTKVWEETGSKNEAELSVILNTYMYRVLKSEALPDLLDKIKMTERFELELGDKFVAFQEKLKELKDQRPANRSEALKRESAQKRVASEYWRETGLFKAKFCMDWVNEEIERYPEDKFIIWCIHKEVVKEVSSRLKVPHITGDGDISKTKREKLLQPIISTTDPMRVAILTMKAYGVGITLAPGPSRAIWIELDPTPAMMTQSEDRLHRMGTVKQVYCTRLYVPGTYDDNSNAKLRYKQKLIDKTVDGY